MKIYIVEEVQTLDPETLMMCPAGIRVAEFEPDRETEKSYVFDKRFEPFLYNRVVPKSHPLIGTTPGEAIRRYITQTTAAVQAIKNEIARLERKLNTDERNLAEAAGMLNDILQDMNS